MDDKNNRYSTKEYAEIKEKERNELNEILQKGIRQALESDKYKTFLNLMSKCHNYSYTNSILIIMQNSLATVVKSFNDWKKDKVLVNKGEKGIKIYTPIKKTVNLYDKDENGSYKLNENGEKIKIGEREIVKFRIGNVFDISQTNADKEKYSLFVVNNDKVENKDDILKKLENASGINFDFKANLGGALGCYSPKENKIKIKANMNEIDTISTCVHEVAHSILHNQNNELKLSKEQKEFEAESVAFVVCNELGVNSKDNNFLYLANWVGKDDLKEFENSLERIQKASNKILKEFEIKSYENLKQNSLENEI